MFGVYFMVMMSQEPLAASPIEITHLSNVDLWWGNLQSVTIRSYVIFLGYPNYTNFVHSVTIRYSHPIIHCMHHLLLAQLRRVNIISPSIVRKSKAYVCQSYIIWPCTFCLWRLRWKCEYIKPFSLSLFFSFPVLFTVFHW